MHEHRKRITRYALKRIDSVENYDRNLFSRERVEGIQICFLEEHTGNTVQKSKCSLRSMMLFPHAIHCLVAKLMIDHVPRRLSLSPDPKEPAGPIYGARPPPTILAMFPLPLLEKMLIIPKPT